MWVGKMANTKLVLIYQHNKRNLVKSQTFYKIES